MNRLARCSGLSGVVLFVFACGGGAGGTGGGESTSSATTTATGGAGGAPAGTGGAGGMAPAGCSPYEPTSCDMGLTCVVVDDALGLDGGTTCMPPGMVPAYAICSTDSDCEAGSLCDREMQTCKPVCETNADCPGEGLCYQALTSGGVAIPGLELCVATCDPVSTAPCDPSEGDVNCVYLPMKMAFDCAPSGDGMENTACTADLECDTGLGCLEVNGDSGCLNWCVYDGGTDICTSEEHPTASFAICVPQSPSVSFGNVNYGGCLVVM